MDMPIVDLSGQEQPKPQSEAEKHLRGISTVLGKLLPELKKTIGETAEAHTDVLREVSGGVDQVCTEISDLTAAVHDLTELVKEMAVFPRQHWSRARQVIGWFRR